MKTKEENERPFVPDRKPGRICGLLTGTRTGFALFERGWSEHAKQEFAAAFGSDAARRAEGITSDDGESK